MADHKVKFNEVPKGQKMQFLWDYYKWPFVIFLIIAVCITYFVKLIFFTPAPDISVIVTGKYYYSDEDTNAIKGTFQKLLSSNGEDEKNISVISIQYNSDMYEYDSQQFLANSSKLTAELSTVDSLIYVCDETMFGYLKDEDLVASNKEIGGDGKNDIKIPLSKIINNERYKDLYVTLRPKKYSQTEESTKNSERYEIAVNLIKILAENAPES